MNVDCENHKVEVVGSYQKRIDALQSQIQEKDEQMKKLQDQSSVVADCNLSSVARNEHIEGESDSGGKQSATNQCVSYSKQRGHHSMSISYTFILVLAPAGTRAIRFFSSRSDAHVVSTTFFHLRGDVHLS